MGSRFRHGYRFALLTLQFLPAYLILGFPGWVSALPFVLLFKDAKGWRCWTILTIGTILGPLVIFTWCMLTPVGFSWRTDGSGIVMSLCIGFLTIAFYVALLRRFDRKPLRTASKQIHTA